MMIQALSSLGGVHRCVPCESSGNHVFMFLGHWKAWVVWGIVGWWHIWIGWKSCTAHHGFQVWDVESWKQWCQGHHGCFVLMWNTIKLRHFPWLHYLLYGVMKPTTHQMLQDLKKPFKEASMKCSVMSSFKMVTSLIVSPRQTGRQAWSRKNQVFFYTKRPVCD